MDEGMVITISGRDRPGIVANVSRIVYQSQCRLEDLSQTTLGGQFAMILIAEAPREEFFTTLAVQLNDLARDLDLEIDSKKIPLEEMIPFEAGEAGETEPFIITVRGEDQPGLVYGITSVLAEREINITNLDAKATRREQNSAYIHLYEVDIPKSLDSGRIREKLLARGREMGVAVDLQPQNVFQASNQKRKTQNPTR
jgi:glycine cleavage system transcriptional repressor